MMVEFSSSVSLLPVNAASVVSTRFAKAIVESHSFLGYFLSIDGAAGCWAFLAIFPCIIARIVMVERFYLVPFVCVHHHLRDASHYSVCDVITSSTTYHCTCVSGMITVQWYQTR